MIGDTTALERRALLALAHQAVAHAAGAEPGEEPPGAPPEGLGPQPLDRPGAAFVTLRVAGALRGCIGTFEPRPSLWQTVHDMATAAATRDPRFAPISKADLPALGVDISVLAPGRRIRGPGDIELGRHGLEVRQGFAHGLLLPQVAADHALDREGFLAETCRKAGLPPDAWREPATEIRVFEADVFGDE